MGRTSLVVILLAIVISFAVSIYFYNSLPAQIATHWNAAGESDDYSGKLPGLFLLPFILIVMLILYIIIPFIDPLKENIEKFRKYYELIFAVIFVFLLYIHILSIIFNLGYSFNFSFMIVPAVGILFMVLGVMMKHSERNWFVGIRTPWTLSSDKVWRETHKLGGRLFQISGVLVLIGLFFTRYFLWFALVPVLLSSIISVIYSYIVYRRLKKK